MSKVQRDKRLEFLENSFRKIAMGVNRSPNNKNNEKLLEGLEEAITTIQLYGEPKLIETLKKLPSLDATLEELRNEFREELGLKKIEDDIKQFRTEKELEEIKNFKK